MIQVKNLYKNFWEKLMHLMALTSIFKKVKKVVIIGPSWMLGKALFYAVLNLLEKPSSGEIWFEGNLITDPSCDIDRLRRKMGMVFQQFNLFPHMTILKNITLAPVQLKLMDRQQAEEKAMALLQRIGLQG